jgi:hypothetical protein
VPPFRRLACCGVGRHESPTSPAAASLLSSTEEHDRMRHARLARHARRRREAGVAKRSDLPSASFWDDSALFSVIRLDLDDVESIAPGRRGTMRRSQRGAATRRLDPMMVPQPTACEWRLSIHGEKAGTRRRNLAWQRACLLVMHAKPNFHSLLPIRLVCHPRLLDSRALASRRKRRSYAQPTTDGLRRARLSRGRGRR